VFLSKSYVMEILDKIYPHCRSILNPNDWDKLVAAFREDQEPEDFHKTITARLAEWALPGFLPDLAHVEWAVYMAQVAGPWIPPDVDRPTLNPTVELHSLSWKHLIQMLNRHKDSDELMPEPGEEIIAVWRMPQTNEVRAERATDEDLLVLKIVVEGIDPDEVAQTAGLHAGAIDAAVRRAAARGLLLIPRSGIRRDPLGFPVGQITDDQFFSAPAFVLQWHITQACDLHCKHCYDRSKRSPLTLDQGIRVLDDLYAFCKTRHVGGQVAFTGGNPLLHPHVFELYRAAADRGFVLSMLGNPAPREQIEKLLEIRRPSHFQVSLEGQPEHNDMIRGEGHFERVMVFLTILRDLGVSSMVMLTLTKDNINQVLPLAELLRDRTDLFTFNRLSRVGEGAHLELPSPEDYEEFLKAYMQAAETNPVLSLKDNLFGILLHKSGLPPSGGCTGYGCGAAFNFIALLPDGEVHACRKFPSPIGNAYVQSIAEIYDSELAHRYRNGTHACRSCAIRPVCGGCLAVAHSNGLDIFEDRDPYCFMDDPGNNLMTS
jgi:selenobiotic family peptide radical SAM maturase